MGQAADRHRILVVDDEPDVQALIGEVLWDEGNDVEFAATGALALERAALGDLDLVVLDLGLPDMDGHLVLERLHAAATPPPVIVVSVRSDYASFARALRQGAAAYVVKPFRVRELVEEAGRILSGQAARERRREPRQTLAAGVRVMGLDGEVLSLGELVDLSPVGAQVRLSRALQPRAGIRLAVDTARCGTLDIEGRIAWRGAGATEFPHGLGFVNVTAEHQGRLRDLLAPS